MPQAAQRSQKRLSPRESLVYSYLTAGRDIKDIAFELDIAYNTVHTTATDAARKLGFRTPTDLRVGGPVAKRCYDLALAAGSLELAAQIQAEFHLVPFPPPIAA